MSPVLASYAFGPFVLDLHSRRLLKDGQPVPLQPRPLALLSHLVTQPGRLVSKDELLEVVWRQRVVGDAVLKVAINAVRAALGDPADEPRYIETSVRQGYRFVAGVSTVTARPLPAVPPARGNLPAVLPVLVGREDEQQLLGNLLAEQRLVTVVGIAGVGKTRLALAAAALHAPADGVWLVPLESVADAQQLPAAIAAALQMPPAAGRNVQSIGRALVPLAVRLVLDGAEHLVDGLSLAAAGWLAAAPGLQLLVTSQRALRLRGEQLLPLGPLPVPAADTAEPLQAAASRLFVSHVRAVQPGFVPSPAQVADIAMLCRRLDGLPLALELAAARVPTLGVAGVAAQMDDRFALLSRGARDALGRHRTLRAALEWSFERLSEEEQRVLRRLSVFVSGFEASQAQDVAADPGEPGWVVLDALDTLREHSLLIVEGAERPRWRMLLSVRELAARRLDAAGETAATRLRHALALCRHFEAADAAYLMQPAFQWLDPLRADVDNLRAALTLVGGSGRLAVELFVASALFWVRAGFKTEALHWAEATRTAALEPHDDLLRARWALALAALSTYAQKLGAADARADLPMAIDSLERAGDRRRAYLGLYFEAQLRLRQADPGDLTPLLNRMRRLEEPGWTGRARSFAGWVEATARRRGGDPQAYADFCRFELQRCESDADLASASAASDGLAQLLWSQGRLDEAIDALDLAVERLRCAGRQREGVTTVAMAASLRMGRDAGAESVATLREAAVLLQAEGMLWWLGDALVLLPARQGRWADALAVRAWLEQRLTELGEQRGPVARDLQQRVDQLWRAHSHGAPPLPDPTLSDAEVPQRVFGPGAPR